MQVSNKIEMRALNTIKPYIRNPRKNDKTVDKLVELIPQVGFNVPIVIDKDGIIVKGHSRFKAAIRLGMEEVPCIITYADEEAIKLDRIADNRVSEFSEWINESLMHELDIVTLDSSMLEFIRPNVADFDFDMDFSDESESGESREDKLKRFQELQEQSQQSTQIVTPAQVQKAVEKQYEQSKQTEYFEFVCSYCGEKTLVAKSDFSKYTVFKED